MKRVLITGANSYVGTNVEKWLMKDPENFYVDTLDMKDPNWVNFDFSSFDVVFHVAGIAHVSTKRSMKDKYFKVNRDLTIETAKKAKESGVKQFIFMSSMIVYSSKETRITLETKPNPDNFYGLSKLQAEHEISLLQSETFNVAILRPPMIYGIDIKGNLEKIIKFASKVRIFPDYPNKKSILSLNRLSEYISMIIANQVNGIIYPRDNFQRSTTEIVELFCNNIRIHKTKFFNVIIRILFFNNIIRKVFGDFYYDITDSIILNEKDNKKEMII